MTPSAWVNKPVSELIESETPGFWGQEATGNNDVAVLRSTNLRNDGRLDLASIAYRSFPEAKLRTKLLQPGDILLERSGGGPKQPVGRVALFESSGRYSCSNFMQRLRPNPKVVESKFLYYALFHLHASGVTEQLQQATTGIRNLSYKDYLAWQICIPPLAEQKKIAAILGSVDDAIQATQAVIDQTRKIKQGLLQQLLTRGIGHTRFKQTELGLLPESWEVRSIRELSKVVRGSSPRPAGDPRYFNGDFIPWVTVGEVTRDEQFILMKTSTSLTEEGAKRSRTLPEGTLILTNSGATLGVPKILGIEGCANDGIAAFLNLNSNVDRLFLYYYLSTLTNWLREEVAPGLGQPNLNTELIGNLLAPIPPIDEQVMIASKLRDFDDALTSFRVDLDQLEIVKAGLMSDLLTGRTRVEVSA
jgi:type I restriction enzyme S subunit